MVVVWGWFGAGFNSHQKSTLLGTSLFSISLIDYILLDLLVDSGLFSQIKDKEDNIYDRLWDVILSVRLQANM